ncbi:hypothetical protein CBM2585_A60026 [Cupriavidus taiwanensis]|nr:hypothetical protein CBM2585_A60026 [Cupriavidus taiwanensis]
MEKTGALTGLRTNRGCAAQPLLICLDGQGKISTQAGKRDQTVASVKLGHRADHASRFLRGTGRVDLAGAKPLISRA